ncbi:MAG: hypothetical protein ABI685_08995 [Ferruginibacter sp.]
MKFILIILISISSSIKIMAQDITRVFINDVKAADVIVKTDETTALLVIKKSSLKNLKSITIQVDGELVQGDLFKRTLQISEEPRITADETKNKPGWFDMTKTDLKKQLAAGKTISLYLVLDPANPMMTMRSRIIFVGKLVMR